MFVTIITVQQGKTQIQQVEAPTVKDCLVAWAGRVDIEGLTNEGRTRLRGDMADFDAPTVSAFANVWRFESNLGLEGPPEGIVIVVGTERR